MTGVVQRYLTALTTHDWNVLAGDGRVARIEVFIQTLPSRAGNH